MKRVLHSACVLILSLVAASPSMGAVCDLDTNPAATLLLPYFEVDLDHANGTNTLFTVNNAFAAAQLAHVTLWTDLSSPVLDFNTYLTGFDMQTFDLRQLLVNGVIPRTASAGQDPADTISPKGVFSQDINFASCTGQLPIPSPLPPIFITHLQNSLTGRPSVVLGGFCAGRNLGDHIARGYITIDVVKNCTLRFPSDIGYFGVGGDASDANVLFGDYTYVNRIALTSVSQNLVGVKASATDAATTTPGNYTFYGRYVGWNASDHRQPLATTFGVRYTDDRSDLVVWRDSKVVQNLFTCGTLPSWVPLNQESVFLFDEQETASILAPEARPFPAEAQRTGVGSAQLPTPFGSGWTFLDLNTAVAAAGANPPVDPNAAQAYVSVLFKDALGRFLSGYDAMRYDSACSPNHATPGF